MTTESKTYPVTIKGDLVAVPSRGLWLVKWFLAIPHYFCIAGLSIASLVVSFIAFIAIVFTGKYPKGLFDFNVGVMRWSWRVNFYALALGTDKYPPFSLMSDPNYPADLEITYQEKLHRGLVWVKWFLAIPHYFIISLFYWVSTSGPRMYGNWQWGAANVHWMNNGAIHSSSGTYGIAFLLAIFAGICLLFAHKFPKDIFRLLVGINRWSIRVSTYILMRDEYPPFRFWDS